MRRDARSTGAHAGARAVLRALALAALLGAGVGCGVPGPGLVINEVCSSTDFIELYNPTEATVDLSGWAVSDASPDKSGHKLTFPEGSTLPAGGFWPLRKDGYMSFTFGLGAVDRVQLFEASGLLVDETEYPANEAVVSWCRYPDGTGLFQVCSEATLGRENVAGSAE